MIIKINNFLPHNKHSDWNVHLAGKKWIECTTEEKISDSLFNFFCKHIEGKTLILIG